MSSTSLRNLLSALVLVVTGVLTGGCNSSSTTEPPPPIRANSPYAYPVVPSGSHIGDLYSIDGGTAPAVGAIWGAAVPPVDGGTSGPLISTGGALTWTNPLPVGNGGTGAITFAAHAVLVGQGTSPVTALGPGSVGSPLLGQGVGADPIFSSTPMYLADAPSLHGLIEWDAPPDSFGSTMTSGTGQVTVVRLVPFTGGAISNVWTYVTTLGSGLTAATTATVTGTVNNGGVVQLTAVNSYSNGDVVTVASVGGTVEANGGWVVTNATGTSIDLSGSSFQHNWTAGGTITRSANAWALYNASGAFLCATGDQVAAWGSTGVKTAAWLCGSASSTPLTAGSNYWIGVLSVGTTPVTVLASGASINAVNVNESGSTVRGGVNPLSGATKLASSLTTSATAAGAKFIWIGLN